MIEGEKERIYRKIAKAEDEKKNHRPEDAAENECQPV
jgi:hypothetical protein